VTQKEDRPDMGIGPANKEAPDQGATTNHDTPPGYFAVVPVRLFGRVSVRSVGVYAGYSSFAYGKLTASPTEAEVAERLNISPRTVRRALSELVEAKAIEVAPGKGAVGGRYLYTFTEHPGQWVKVPVALLGRVCPAAVGMYAVLRSYENYNGVYPAVLTMAERAGICHTQAKDYLRELRRAGAFQVVHRVDDKDRTTSNRYLLAEVPRQTAVVPGQGHNGAALGTNPAGGCGQIPPGVGDKSRPQPRTLTQNTDLDLDGWTAPSARWPHGLERSEVSPGTGEPGLDTDAVAEPGQNTDVPGNNSAPGQNTDDLAAVAEPGKTAPASGQNTPGPGPNTSFKGGDSPISPNGHTSNTSNRKVSGWIHQPLADQDKERQALDLVDLFAQGQVDLGRNKPSQATRDAWLASSRNMLDGPNKRPYAEVRKVIQDVCRDDYWSGRVKSMWDVADNWDKITDEFKRRTVRDVRVARVVRARERADKRVAERNKARQGQAETQTERQRVGCVSLSELGTEEQQPHQSHNPQQSQDNGGDKQPYRRRSRQEHIEYLAERDRQRQAAGEQTTTRPKPSGLGCRNLSDL
jgi:hypothetical protein